MKKILLWIACTIQINAISQIDYSGTEFWFNSCETNAPLTSNNIVRIIGDVATTGTVTVPGTGFSQDFCFNSGGNFVDVFIPTADHGLSSSNIVENTAVRVTSDNEVMVVYFSKVGVDSDYFLVPPVSSLGKEYYTNMPKGSGFWNPAYTQITASENGTTVNIFNPTSELGPFSWGVGNDIAQNTVTSILLNEGESYRIQAGQDVTTGPASNLQYSGTQITTDKPVFTSSAMSTNLPDLSIPYADQLRSDLLPKSTWGTSYYSAPFKHGQLYLLQILSADNGNTISIDGLPAITLNQYESFDTIVSGNKKITSTFAINVVQCSLSKNYTSAPIGDPSQLNLISESNFDTEFHDYLNTFGSDIDSVIFMITAKTTDLSTTTINGSPVSPSLFLPIAGTPYSHGTVSYAISPGTGQFLTFNSTSPMMVYKSAMQKNGSGSNEWQISRNVGRLQNVPNSNVYDSTCALITPLPSDLVSFKGVHNELFNTLLWKTASERNTNYFLIEKSLDGQEFMQLGIVPAAGNSNELIHYEMVDEFPSPNLNYYRLKTIDVDGFEEVSNTIAISGVSREKLSVYPNPVGRKLTIAVPESMLGSYCQITITDALGKMQTSINQMTLKHTVLNTSKLKPGMYFLTIKNEQMTLTSKFNKN